MEFLSVFTNPAAWLALLTLLFLEIVLGIDNVVFISVTTSKLPKAQQKPARTTGLLLAMVARIALLFGVSVLMQLTDPIISFRSSWISGAVSWQSMIVFAGGLFLLYKSVTEVHNKIGGQKERAAVGKGSGRFWGVIAQVVVLDIVFSFDSILTAVGMIGFKTYGYGGSMALMITAIIISVIIMMGFSGWISRIVNKYPTIQMLALSFLMLIAVMLLAEAAHLSGIVILNHEVHEIPRGYIYFAIAFSLMVEVLNIRVGRKRSKKKALGRQGKTSA